MTLPEFGVKRPVTNLMIFLSIIVLSLYSFSRIGIDRLPKIEPPSISILSVYPGASPEDVEVKVTETLENQLATLPGLEKITSRSIEGLSAITLKFIWGTNLDEATNDIRDRIDLAKRFLPDIPDEMNNPIIFKFNTANIPIVFLGITADKSYPGLYDLIDARVADAIRQLPGVGTVQIEGGLRRQINVWIDRHRLEGYGFSIIDIMNALRKENVTQPVGNLKSGLTDYLLRLPGEFGSPEEINTLLLGKYDNKFIYLKDIAQVEDGFAEVTTTVRIKKRQGLLMMVQKQTDTNTVEVASRVKKKLAELQNTLPQDVKMHIIFDTSADIINSLNSLKLTLWRGIGLVVFVVWIFLRQFSPSLIIALTIPFSLLIAFIYMFLTGKTINTISLSSIAIASGMVVDNAIVIVDNVFRHMEKGSPPKEAAILGASEMLLPIGASTLTTIVVFLPMIFITGVIGITFGEMAIIVTATLLASLFTAVTFSPLLCSRWLKLKTERKKGGWFKSWEDFYAQALKFSLNHKKLVILGFFGLFIFSLLLLPFVGNEFMPSEDTGDLRITTQFPIGTRLEETEALALKIEEILEKEVPEARFYYARSGQVSGTGRVFNPSSGSHVVIAGAKLVSKQQRKRSVDEIAQVVRERIRRLAGVIKVDIISGNPLGRLITGMGGKAIQIEIIGHSFEETGALANKIKTAVEKIPGTVDVSISRELSRPEIRLEVDRQKAASLGLDMQTIADSLKAFIEGSSATKYRESGETYDIYVRLKEPSRQSIEDIENLFLVSPLTKKPIRLSNICRLKEFLGPLDIERQNRERVLRVECNLYRRSLGKVVEDVEAALGKITIPEGIRVNIGGEAEEQKKAFKDLALLFVLGITLVYMVMASQFESLRDPFIVMFSVPFTFIGVIVAFILTRTTLSVITFLGIIMLTGIVVNNAIVLISYINMLRKRGTALFEAVTSAGRERLRPVLMTTITTLAGLLPLAISKGEGSEAWQPLGITMLGGLTVSTLITMLFVPTLYFVFEAKLKSKA